MNAQETYRVIGVRADGSQKVICDRAKRRQANQMNDLLDDTHVFRSIEIEAEVLPAPKRDRQANVKASHGRGFAD